MQTQTMHARHAQAPYALFNAVLVSNLGGTTGALLGLDGGNLAAQLRLDVLYPVRGFKRCLDARNGFGAQCRIEAPLSSPRAHADFGVYAAGTRTRITSAHQNEIASASMLVDHG